MRFRAKVMLGFAVVLAISAVSMGIAYLGFERVSVGVTSYRKSVSEADLARNIDRGQTRFNDATRTPVFFLKTLQTRQRRSRIQC